MTNRPISQGIISENSNSGSKGCLISLISSSWFISMVKTFKSNGAVFTFSLKIKEGI